MGAGSFRIDKESRLLRISSWILESEPEFFGVEILFEGLSGYSKVFAFVRGHVECRLFCERNIQVWINAPMNFIQSDFLADLD